jgi:hypothetical protein
MNLKLIFPDKNKGQKYMITIWAMLAPFAKIIGYFLETNVTLSL